MRLTSEESNNIINDYVNNKISLRQLEIKYNHSRKFLAKYLREHNIEVRQNDFNSRKYTHNENFFEIIDNEHKAYWLGFFYADGFIVNKTKHMRNQQFGITLMIDDIGHLYKFKNDIQATNPIHIYNQEKKRQEGFNCKDSCRILLSSQKTVDDLIKQGCIEHKTLILKYPTVKQVPINLQRHFIRGYFDGDGSISFNSRDNRCNMSFTGTYDMLLGIAKFLNLSHSIYNYKDRQASSFHVSGSIQNNKKFIDTIYSNCEIFLDRKKAKIEQVIKNNYK